MLGDDFHRAATEIEPLGAADDRGRHLVRLGRREDEPHAHRGLLEHLQQRVERLARQALRLVDDVHLLAALDRGGWRLLAEIAGVVDTAVARGVDLDDVQVLALAYRDALVARATGLGRGTLLAVDHLREDPSGRRLAGPARTAEQERVGQPALADGPGESADHVVLPEHLAGPLRPVLPIEGLVLLVLGHAHPSTTPLGRGSLRERCGGRAPAVDHVGLERITGRLLRSGVPAAPASARLRLLPSGPDRVHRLASRGTRPSTLRAGSDCGPDGPRAGIQPR